MDHVVYTDARSKEMEKLISKVKTMIIRGAAGRKLPHGRVNEGDTLYLINNNGEGIVKAKCTVKKTFNSDKMNIEDSIQLVEKNATALSLSDSQLKKWAGKRYLVLIEISNVQEVEPFAIDRSGFGNMDDWLPVGDINKVRI